jgi:hypothetical protein
VRTDSDMRLNAYLLASRSRLALSHDRLPVESTWGASAAPRVKILVRGVIDAVATNMMIAEPTREMRLPIGGIAHAGIQMFPDDRR